VLASKNDRISYWYLGAIFAWALCFLLFGIPIFHLGLGFSITKIAISVGICCGMQLAIMPWLFSARATTQNPDGLVDRRIVVVVVWHSLTALCLAYYIQRGWPSSQAAQHERIFMYVTVIVSFIILGLIFYYNTRSVTRILRLIRNKARVVQATDDSHPVK
jgi:hypothetical protein